MAVGSVEIQTIWISFLPAAPNSDSPKRNPGSYSSFSKNSRIEEEVII
jgi:hypothetical protein